MNLAVEPSYQITIEYEGRTYYRTGKTGTHIASGEHSAEYANHSNYGQSGNVERRVWVRFPSGTIEAD